MSEQLVLPVVFSWECPHCSYATISAESAGAHPAKCRRWLPSLFEVPCRDIVNIRTELGMSTPNVDYVRCRCCGCLFTPRPRLWHLTESTCRLCLNECTNEGCVVASWLPVRSEDE